MAKGARKGSAVPNPQPAPDQGSNEALKAGPQRPGIDLSKLVVPHGNGITESVNARTALIKKNESNIKLDEASILMHQVQTAQRNLTDCLNALSLYRKEVARILERERREAAQARKAAGQTNKSGGNAPSLIEPQDEEVGTDV